jgi:hypothetical protein
MEIQNRPMRFDMRQHAPGDPIDVHRAAPETSF